jgi:hypothetical protein
VRDELTEFARRVTHRSGKGRSRWPKESGRFCQLVRGLGLDSVALLGWPPLSTPAVTTVELLCASDGVVARGTGLPAGYGLSPLAGGEDVLVAAVGVCDVDLGAGR